MDLVHAKRIVTAGMGAANEQLLAAVAELADLLEGSVGATRPVVDEGRLPKERLIGQTGRTVAPELYVALGVSGSPHHVAGVRKADRVLSINRDVRAPIFQFSDVGYVADLEEVLPALIEKIKAWRDAPAGGGAAAAAPRRPRVGGRRLRSAAPDGGRGVRRHRRRGRAGRHQRRARARSGRGQSPTAGAGRVSRGQEHVRRHDGLLPGARAAHPRFLEARALGAGRHQADPLHRQRRIHHLAHLPGRLRTPTGRPSAPAPPPTRASPASPCSGRSSTAGTRSRRWRPGSPCSPAAGWRGCSCGKARSRGVQVAGIDDIVEAPLVVACDGTLSLLAKEAGHAQGLQRRAGGPGGARALRHDRGGDRRALRLTGREGATQEFLGCTEGVRGGGFIYTQTDALSVGLVFHLDSLKERSIPPYELLERFVASAPVAPLLRGARMVEYSAHLLPEAGIPMVPKLSMAGLLVAGDAAGFCYTNGLTQEGMNLAMTSGVIAAQGRGRSAGRGRLLRRPAGEVQGGAQGQLRPARPRHLGPGHRLHAPRPAVHDLSADDQRPHGGPLPVRRHAQGADPATGPPGGRRPDRARSAACWPTSSKREGGAYDPRRTVRSGELPDPSGGPHHAGPGDVQGLRPSRLHVLLPGPLLHLE